MTNRKKLIVVSALVVCGAAWYAFRPERLFINKTVNEALPVASAQPMASANTRPVVLAAGSFHDGAHKTSGLATIYQLPEGKRVLRLTNFETSNGPDVRVFLVAANDATDNDTVKRAGYISLGSLKGNVGDQNYDLPANVDLQKYRAATIWCNRFSVNFGTAPLQASTSEASLTTLASGHFHGVAHETQGAATIYQLPDGKRLLRLTEFKTSNGPDVQVYLVAANDANDSDTVKKAGFVPVGALKGNQGDQNYELSANLDLSKYHAVTIWCRRFGVNFATAPLAMHN